jgi:hypothetical protein
VENIRTITVACCCGQSLHIQGFDEKITMEALSSWSEKHAACRELLQERSKCELKEAKERMKDRVKLRDLKLEAQSGNMKAI